MLRISLSPTVALLAAAALSMVGCGLPANDSATIADATPLAPFFGLPEDCDQKIGDDPADAQSALRGNTTMTAVKTVDYDNYQRLKKDGRIKREEKREKVVYFATEEVMHAPAPGAGGGHGEAYIVVTTRYKAAVQ
jgi:hypothetical protein